MSPTTYREIKISITYTDTTRRVIKHDHDYKTFTFINNENIQALADKRLIASMKEIVTQGFFKIGAQCYPLHCLNNLTLTIGNAYHVNDNGTRIYH